MKKMELTVNGKIYHVEVSMSGGEVARVTVNGSQYDVAFKNLPEEHVVTTSSAELHPKTPSVPVSSEPQKPRIHASEGVTVVKAPLPGLILDVKVKVGDVVKEGDTLIVIETMKMENNVISPLAGTVREIRVAKDQTVSEGIALVVISK